jgi:hypothetical protein
LEYAATWQLPSRADLSDMRTTKPQAAGHDSKRMLRRNKRKRIFFNLCFGRQQRVILPAQEIHNLTAFSPSFGKDMLEVCFKFF